VDLVAKNITKFDIHKKTVDELKLGYKEVISIKNTQQALEAFKIIYEKVETFDSFVLSSDRKSLELLL
jgi:hypothetical protein